MFYVRGKIIRESSNCSILVRFSGLNQDSIENIIPRTFDCDINGFPSLIVRLINGDLIWAAQYCLGCGAMSWSHVFASTVWRTTAICQDSMEKQRVKAKCDKDWIHFNLVISTSKDCKRNLTWLSTSTKWDTKMIMLIYIHGSIIYFNKLLCNYIVYICFLVSIYIPHIHYKCPPGKLYSFKCI